MLTIGFYICISMCIYIYTKAFAESHKHSVISIAAVCSAQGWPFLLAIVADKNPQTLEALLNPKPLQVLCLCMLQSVACFTCVLILKPTNPP